MTRTGPALLTTYDAVLGDRVDAIDRFTMRPPRPYGQYDLSCRVEYRKRGAGRMSAVTAVGDDKFYFVITDGAGQTLFDSRSKIPVDAERFDTIRRRQPGAFQGR